MKVIPTLKVPLPSPEDTHRLGFVLGQQVGAQALVAVYGPLGAGKTTMAQGAAQALGVEEVVNSPTFTTINEYTSGRLPFYHLDLYRLYSAFAAGKSPGAAALNMLTIELDELRSAPGLVFIEWAECLAEYVAQQDHIRVELNYSTSADQPGSYLSAAPESQRIALITAAGEQAQQIVEALRKIYFS